MGIGVEGGDAISGDFHRVVAVASIGDGVQDAYVGAHAADYDLAWRQIPQLLRQVSIEEAAVPVLGNNVTSSQKLRQLRDHIWLFGTFHTMYRKYLKFQVVWIMMVGNEENFGAGVMLFGQEAVDVWNDFAG